MNTERVIPRENAGGLLAHKSAFLLFLLALCAGGAPNAYAAETARARTIEPAACPFALPNGIQANCGFLVVPEKRFFDGDGRGRSAQNDIRIAFMVARSPYGNPAPDPIVYVTGGPSAAAISPGNVSYLASLFLAANRDLVLVDQRGTGISQPRLDCPEFDGLSAATFPNGPSRTAYLASVRACRDRLRADRVDLDAYDSAATAADLDDLRVSLGYHQWNVVGLSNGGLATLTMMRLHPEGIRSVVLDSPSSNDNLHVVDRWRAPNRLLEMVFTDCAADPTCNSRYPSLRATFYGLIDELRAHPVDVPIRNPAGGPPLWVHITGDVLLSAASSLITDPALLPSLPATIYFAVYGGLAQVVQAAIRAPSASSRIYAYGKTLSTLCSDTIPFETPWERSRAARAMPEFKDLLLDPDVLEPINREACEVWNVHRAPAFQHLPVYSSIPTLIVNGEFDGVVSPDEGKRIGNSLSHGRYYRIPGVGHVVLSGKCATEIASQFLAHPDVKPNTDCLGSLPEIVFGH